MENILVNVDSEFRDTRQFPNSGKFSWKLSEKIKNCKYIRLSSIEFPNLFYSFTEAKKNTFFTIDTSSNSYYINIESGIYIADLMVQTVNTLFTPANNNGNKCLLTLEPINGKVTISNNYPFTINFLNNSTIYSSLGYQLGFRKNTYVSSSKIITGTTSVNGISPGQTMYYITSEGIIDIIVDNYFFLKINDFGVLYNDYKSISTTDGVKRIQSDKNILAKVILYNNKGENNFDNGSNFLTKSYIFRQPTDISKFDIEIIDSYGVTIDMNTMNFSFTIEIGTVIDSNTYMNQVNDNMTNRMQIGRLLDAPNNIDTANQNFQNKESYTFKPNFSNY